MTKSLQTRISIFRGKNIRKTVYKNEWWFSIVDVSAALTDSLNAGAYWRKLKQRLGEEGSEVVTFCHKLKLVAPDGKKYFTDCANTEGVFRIIQSIPFPKAEPFKRWLARVGYERVQEIEDPELGMKRTYALYKAKGYPDDWVSRRMRGIAIREDLTDEWRNRDIKLEKEYAILTAEISRATFGMTPSQYKKFKGLKRQNLRDHMDEVELLFSMLGEVSTARITQARDAQGFKENRKTAQDGGRISGNARIALEKQSRRKVSTRRNYVEGYRSGKQISS
ncbi:MAG: Prophage antirepressor [Candidatus Woesebacteria bacterium GW2011_GWB1_41_10]|uniref:Prophage antirepressor n=1 Tax=Candidatus Woesebacteria bacterium GW2011_GWB1_41_10 TaxID=1618577 RepID=A0A0G0UEI8_9BACT|nr:MAG: Prophage antirepressor [Candidatus Woesebacteria bacterium GW2011_GWB1_41_10]